MARDAVDLVGELERLLLEPHAVARLLAMRCASVCVLALANPPDPSSRYVTVQ